MLSADTLTSVQVCDARNDAMKTKCWLHKSYITDQTSVMEYNFREIEKKWQQRWKDTNAYKVSNPSTDPGQVAKPKFYVLDMFPYPSGAGLHVGHPLGYIAS